MSQDMVKNFTASNVKQIAAVISKACATLGVLFIISMILGVGNSWVDEKWDDLFGINQMWWGVILQSHDLARYFLRQAWIAAIFSDISVIAFIYCIAPSLLNWFPLFGTDFAYGRGVTTEHPHWLGFAILQFPEDISKALKASEPYSEMIRVLVFLPRKSERDDILFASQIWPYRNWITIGWKEFKVTALTPYKIATVCLIAAFLVVDYLIFESLVFNRFWELIANGLLMASLFVVLSILVPLNQMKKIINRCSNFAVVSAFGGRYLAREVGDHSDCIFFCPVKNAENFDLKRASELYNVYNRIRKRRGFLEPVEKIVSQEEWLALANGAPPIKDYKAKKRSREYGGA